MSVCNEQTYYDGYRDGYAAGVKAMRQTAGEWVNGKCSECGNGGTILIRCGDRWVYPRHCPFCGVKIKTITLTTEGG